MITAAEAGTVSLVDEFARAGRLLPKAGTGPWNDLVHGVRSTVAAGTANHVILETEALFPESLGRALLQVFGEFPSYERQGARMIETVHDGMGALPRLSAQQALNLRAAGAYLNYHRRWTNGWMRTAFNERVMAPSERTPGHGIDQMLLAQAFRGTLPQGPWHVDADALNSVTTLLGTGTGLIPRTPQSFLGRDWDRTVFSTVEAHEVTEVLPYAQNVPRGRVVVFAAADHRAVTTPNGDLPPLSPLIHGAPKNVGDRLAIIEPFATRSLVPPEIIP